jgi:hypothetical protein
MIFAHGLVAFGANFRRDGLTHVVYEVRIPGSRHADDLRKVCGIAGEGDAMQTLVPPIVPGDTQSGDGDGVIAHLRRLLFEGHASDKVIDSLIDRECRIHERKNLGCWLLLGNGIKRWLQR